MEIDQKLAVLVQGACTFFAVEAASAVFLVIEYFQTLPLEVELIWPDQMNLLKGLFMLNRYGTLVATTFAFLLSAIAKSKSFELCRIGIFAQGLVVSFNLGMSEMLLFMRVYALSGSNRYIGAFLATFWTGIFIGLMVNVYQTTQIIEFMAYPTNHYACMSKPVASQLCLSLPFFLIMAEQIVVMVLCIYYGIYKHWSSFSRPLRTFSRDGMYYFAAITVMSMLNVGFNLSFPGKFQHYFGTPQGVFQSALASRLVLHLRKQANDAKFEVAKAKAHPVTTVHIERILEIRR